MALRIAGEQPQHLVPVIRTVLVEPDLNRVCLVFVGQLKVAVPLSPARAETIQNAIVLS